MTDGNTHTEKVRGNHSPAGDVGAAPRPRGSQTNGEASAGARGQAGEAVYLYCFARLALLRHINGKGVDDQNPLFLRRYRDIVAVASMVSGEKFSGPSAEARMQDLSWVGPRACWHERVVEEVMCHSPVLPVRFGTIFSSVEILEKVLKRHHNAICHFLHWVADKEEWAVKGLLTRARAKEAVVSTARAAYAEQLASSSPGKRYFQERRIRENAEKELACRLEETCRAVAADLNRRASDFRRRNVLPHNTEGTEMVANWAFLVPRNAVSEFRAQVEKANSAPAQQGLHFELSGPWPPYSFCPCLEGESEK